MRLQFYRQTCGQEISPAHFVLPHLFRCNSISTFEQSIEIWEVIKPDQCCNYFNEYLDSEYHFDPSVNVLLSREGISFWQKIYLLKYLKLRYHYTKTKSRGSDWRLYRKEDDFLPWPGRTAAGTAWVKMWAKWYSVRQKKKEWKQSTVSREIFYIEQLFWDCKKIPEHKKISLQ